MADSKLSQKRKSATVADFELQDEPIVLLSSPSVKDESSSDDHINSFGKPSNGRRHTSAPKPNNRLPNASSRRTLSNNRSPRSPTSNPPSGTLRHSPKPNSVHSRGSPILGSPTPPLPSSTHTTSTAKLAALRAASAAATSKHSTTTDTTPLSTQPSTRSKASARHTRTAQGAPILTEGSHVPATLPTTTTPTQPKRALSFDGRERQTTSDVWAPLSSGSDASDWCRWQPWNYPYQGYKRLKVAEQEPAVQKNERYGLRKMLDEQEMEWRGNPRRESEELGKALMELQKRLEGLEERNQQMMMLAEQLLQEEEEEEERHEHHDQGELGSELQLQHREDDGDHKGSQELANQAPERFGLAADQQAQEQVQQQQRQQEQDQDHPQEASLSATACPTTPQQSSSSGSVASSPQNTLDVQRHAAVSLDRELLPRVRKVSVTTVVYELEPVSA